MGSRRARRRADERVPLRRRRRPRRADRGDRDDPRHDRVVHRAAAPAQAARRTGGALSRGARAVAQGERHHRRRDAEQRARREHTGAIAGAGRPADAHRARTGASRRRRQGDRRGRTEGERWDSRRGARRGDAAHRVRPTGVEERPQARRRSVARRCRLDAVQHLRRAGERHRREGRRPDDLGEPARLPVGPRRAARAPRRFDDVDAPADDRRLERRVRVPSLRHRLEDAVLRRGERGSLDHVHARRLEPAVRQADRPSVSISGVHAAPAQRRRQHRRHRGAQGHARPRPRRADRADDRRPHCRRGR